MSTTAGSTVAAMAVAEPAAEAGCVGVADAADDCGDSVPVDTGVTRVDAMTTTPAAAPAVMLPRKMKAATIGKRRGRR
jgi:hypothetical protein